MVGFTPDFLKYTIVYIGGSYSIGLVVHLWYGKFLVLGVSNSWDLQNKMMNS